MRSLLPGIFLAAFVSSIAAVAALAELHELPLVSKLSQADRDQITASAHFATAETLFEKGDLLQALRAYQRAHFWEPSAKTPIEKIVPLAFSLDRVDEAVRYALLNAEVADPPLLHRLALYLNEQRDWPAALRLYRLWLRKSPQGADQDAGQRFARLMVQLQVARIAMLVDEIEEASRSFEPVQRVLIDEPTRGVGRSLRRALGGVDADFWQLLGRCHWQAGRIGLAREAFAELAKFPTAVPLANYWQAELAAAEGKSFVAYERLKQYLVDESDSLGSEPFLLHARLLRKLRDQPGRLADLRHLAAERRPYATAALARALADSGDASEAESYYRQVLQSAPETIDEGLALEAANWLIERLASDDRLGDLSLLLPVFARQLSDLEPLSPTLVAALQDASQAERLLSRLDGWSLEGRTADELAAAAWAAKTARRFPLASRMQRAAVSRDSESGAERQLLWAIDLLFDDRYRPAINALMWGIQEKLWSEDDPLPYFYLATAFSLNDQHDVALEAARQAAERQPNDAGVAERVAWVLYNGDRPADARKEYQHVIKQYEDQPDSATRQALKDARMTLSYLTLEQGDAAASAEWLLQVLDEFPADAGAMNDLAYLWAERGEHLARCEQMARRATEAEPTNWAYLDTLAWVQFRLDRPRLALATIQRSLQIAKDQGEAEDGEVLAHRGDILATLGRRPEALADWRKAAELLEDSRPELAGEVRRRFEPVPLTADPGSNSSGS